MQNLYLHKYTKYVGMQVKSKLFCKNERRGGGFRVSIEESEKREVPIRNPKKTPDQSGRAF